MRAQDAVLLAGLAMLGGCHPDGAQTVERDFCSNAAYRAVNVGCKTLIRNARTPDEVEAVEGYCLMMVAAQGAACKEAPDGVR